MRPELGELQHLLYRLITATNGLEKPSRRPAFCDGGYALEREKAKNGEDYPNEVPEDEAFEMEVLRSMTNEESGIVSQIM